MGKIYTPLSLVLGRLILKRRYLWIEWLSAPCRSSVGLPKLEPFLYFSSVSVRFEPSQALRIGQNYRLYRLKWPEIVLPAHMHEIASQPA